MTRSVQSDGSKRQPDERRRNPVVRATILATTYDLLREQGFRQLTIEGVAARAGVGKATIYRWWASKGALAVEAFLIHVTPTIDYTGTGSPRHDIALQMRRLAHAFSGADGVVVREMLAMAQFDGEILRLFNEGYLEPRRAAARTMLALGIERGEFVSGFDPDVIIDGLYGPIHHRLMLGSAMTDEGFLTAIEAAVLGSISTMTSMPAGDLKQARKEHGG